MKVFIDSDEWYPVFTISESTKAPNTDLAIELTQEQYEAIAHAKKEFLVWQEFLRIKWDEL